MIIKEVSKDMNAKNMVVGVRYTNGTSTYVDVTDYYYSMGTIGDGVEFGCGKEVKREEVTKWIKGE